MTRLEINLIQERMLVQGMIFGMTFPDEGQNHRRAVLGLLEGHLKSLEKQLKKLQKQKRAKK